MPCHTRIVNCRPCWNVCIIHSRVFSGDVRDGEDFSVDGFSMDGSSNREGLGFGGPAGTYCGTTLVVEVVADRWCWSLKDAVFTSAEASAENLWEEDDRASDANFAAGLSVEKTPLAGRRRSGGEPTAGSTGLLGSVAWTMWIRSRPAVVVRRSNSWIRLFCIRARSRRRFSESRSNATMSSAICQTTFTTVTSQCTLCDAIYEVNNLMHHGTVLRAAGTCLTI